MDLNDAVRAMLRGVARNEAIIVCPFESRMSWRLYRLAPALMGKLVGITVRRFRERHGAGK